MIILVHMYDNKFANKEVAHVPQFYELNHLQPQTNPIFRLKARKKIRKRKSCIAGNNYPIGLCKKGDSQPTIDLFRLAILGGWHETF